MPRLGSRVRIPSPAPVFQQKSEIYVDLLVAISAGAGSISHRYTTERQTIFFGESFPLRPSCCASRPTPSSGGTPQRPEIRSGAGDALGPARRSGALLRARCLTQRAPHALCLRQSWLQMQAWESRQTPPFCLHRRLRKSPPQSGRDLLFGQSRWPLPRLGS